MRAGRWRSFSTGRSTFIELRNELIAKGYRFRTNSDFEVIANLYDDPGAECVHRLRGMFAIALWDERRQQLLLDTRSVGKKPIYYAERPAGFTCRRSALLRFRAVPPDPRSVAHRSCTRRTGYIRAGPGRSIDRSQSCRRPTLSATRAAASSHRATGRSNTSPSCASTMDEAAASAAAAHRKRCASD